MTLEASSETRELDRVRPDMLPGDDGHTRRSIVYVTRAEPAGPGPDSRQIIDPFTTLYSDGKVIEPPLDPEILMLLAEQNVPHGACLEAKTDDAVGSGWELTRASSDGSTDGEDPESATTAIADMLEDLTPELTFDEILWAASYEEDAVGWSAIEVVRRDGGAPGTAEIGALYPMPAHTVRFTVDKDIVVQSIGGTFRYFARFGSAAKVNRLTGEKEGPLPNGQSVSVPDELVASEAIVFRGYSGRSPYYPIPRWVTAIPTIAELTAIREFNISYFASGGTVDRILHITAGDPVAAQSLADKIDAEFTEQAGQAHVTIVTAGDPQSKVDAVFLVPSQASGDHDGSFKTRRADLVGEVLMSHKVPPYRVAQAIAGVLTGAGPSREMLQAYRAGVVQPRQNKLSSRLNATLFGSGGIDLRGYRFGFKPYTWDETDLDRQLASTIVESAIGSPNEARDVLGLPKSDDEKMDRIYYKGTELGEKPATPPNPFGGPPAPGDGAPDTSSADATRDNPTEGASPAEDLGAVAELRERAGEVIRSLREPVSASSNGHT